MGLPFWMDAFPPARFIIIRMSIYGMLPVELQLCVLENLWHLDSLRFDELLRCERVSRAWRCFLEAKSKELIARTHPGYITATPRRPSNITHYTFAILAKRRPRCPMCKAKMHHTLKTRRFVCGGCANVEAPKVLLHPEMEITAPAPGPTTAAGLTAVGPLGLDVGGYAWPTASAPGPTEAGLTAVGPLSLDVGEHVWPTAPFWTSSSTMHFAPDSFEHLFDDHALNYLHFRPDYNTNP
jgi:hypothetical protein